MTNRHLRADSQTPVADAPSSRFADHFARATELFRTWEISPSKPEELKRATAVAAFSFGLTTTGSPGESNLELADVILVLLRDNPTLKVYVQWEIAEALRHRGFRSPLEHVVTPPRFHVEDIRDSVAFRSKLIQAAPGTVELYVREHLRAFRGTMSDEVLCEGMNLILLDRSFYKGLPARVELPQIEGEFRELPLHSDDLGEYQAMRVNRLILESIFPGELRPGEYLSTWTVVQGIWRDLRDQSVIVVAHPDHAIRCGILLECMVHRVPLYADCRRVPYDPLSAQAWTRNRNDFLSYEIRARRDVLNNHLRQFSGS